MVSTRLGSIAPRLPDDLSDCVGNEISRVPAGDDQLPQLGRGNLELGVRVNVDEAGGFFVLIPYGAGAVIDHDRSQGAHRRSLPARTSGHDDVGEFQNLAPAVPVR